MSSNAVLPDQYSLPKPIDARTHGIIDYSHAALFLGMALLLRKKNKRAAAASLFTGTFVLVQSLLTDYPLGLEPVLSFNLHGKMDAAFAASSFLMPEMWGFSDTGAAALFRLNGVVESTVVALTDWDSNKAELQALQQ